MKRGVVAGCLIAAGSAWAVELEPPARAPVEGRPVTLRFVEAGSPAAGLEVKAIYRENAHAALRREQPIGRTDATGALPWTPEEPGVVVLAWEGGQRSLSVLYDGTPAAGVAVAVLAGLALFGGSALLFFRMLRQTAWLEELDELGEPPST